MEHVARKLNKDPAIVKSLNFYKQGQVSFDSFHNWLCYIHDVRCRQSFFMIHKFLIVSYVDKKQIVYFMLKN